MKHWTDGFDGAEADEPLVRPFTVTGGRTFPEQDNLRLLTLVTAISDVPSEIRHGPWKMQPEHRTILTLCTGPTAVAEVAAALALPVSLTKILIGDLIQAGWMRIRPQLAYTQAGGAPSIAILKAVRDGLRRI
ncbi:DUF742 domain-containing protein [Streptomyces sp. NBC_01176]|uniref:DUF742 domain-containing protein n=1 Tax=Streptomyces sp. NBC_01176 TaxID=2903760 RepID=UPI002F90F681|nr:DUF742 domain-containing protein [Streptomyces sp. NBC_01176]